MYIRMILSSTFTLGLLASSVVTVLLVAFFMGGAIPAAAVLVITVGFNFITWLVAPFFTDLMQGWFYKLRKLSFEQFSTEHPELAAFVRDTCQKNNIPLPKIRIVEDDNPTAYTYGSIPWNARVVGSRGLFRFLSIDEQCAVFAHELGHIRHLDFMVMTLAATMLQVLYEIGHIFMRMKSRGRNNPLPLIGLVSLIFYWVGTYLMLWLSRSREYLADRFSARVMGDPAPLQRALVKIAYGMVECAQAGCSNRLLLATRALGIYDYKAANGAGNALRSSMESSTEGSLALDPALAGFAPSGLASFDPRRVVPVMLFDLYSPWARVSEFASTHPLTGLRLKALNSYAWSLKRTPLFDFAAIEREGSKLDRARLYGRFFFEVLIYFAPWAGFFTGAIVTAISAAFMPQAPFFPAILVGLGAGMLIKGLYRFSAGRSFEPTTMYELMCDPYASPLRGRPVELRGHIIGKAQAGAWLGEDLAMKDQSGGLVNLNYESLVPFFGNLIFAFGGASKSIGQPVVARGWFRRSLFQFVDLADMETPTGLVKSWTKFWGIFAGFVVGLLGVASVVAWAGLMI